MGKKWIINALQRIGGEWHKNLWKEGTFKNYKKKKDGARYVTITMWLDESIGFVSLLYFIIK